MATMAAAAISVAPPSSISNNIIVNWPHHQIDAASQGRHAILIINYAAIHYHALMVHVLSQPHLLQHQVLQRHLLHLNQRLMEQDIVPTKVRHVQLISTVVVMLLPPRSKKLHGVMPVAILQIVLPLVGKILAAIHWAVHGRIIVASN